jgi:hypothetical protein
VWNPAHSAPASEQAGPAIDLGCELDVLLGMHLAVIGERQERREAPGLIPRRIEQLCPLVFVEQTARPDSPPHVLQQPAVTLRVDDRAPQTREFKCRVVKSHR